MGFEGNFGAYTFCGRRPSSYNVSAGVEAQHFWSVSTIRGGFLSMEMVWVWTLRRPRGSAWQTSQTSVMSFRVAIPRMLCQKVLDEGRMLGL